MTGITFRCLSHAYSNTLTNVGIVFLALGFVFRSPEIFSFSASLLTLWAFIPIMTLTFERFLNIRPCAILFEGD